MRQASGQVCVVRWQETNWHSHSLLALGIDELSMSASQAPVIKEQIRNLESGICDVDKILSRRPERGTGILTESVIGSLVE